MTPKTVLTNYVLFIIDSYLLRAAVLNDTNRYVNFLVNVALKNKESRSIIAAVLDTALVFSAPEAKHKLFEKYYKAPTPLPVKPKVHVPGVNMWLSFYKG